MQSTAETSVYWTCKLRDLEYPEISSTCVISNKDDGKQRVDAVKAATCQRAQRKTGRLAQPTLEVWSSGISTPAISRPSASSSSMSYTRRITQHPAKPASSSNRILSTAHTGLFSEIRACLRSRGQQAGAIGDTQSGDDKDSSYDAYIERMRKTEYPQLTGTTYLDHAGTTLYAQSLVDAFAEDLKANLFGNPHSASPSSDLSTTRIEGVRAAVLDYFTADPEHFDVVFVANASAAIKLVMNSFQEHKFSYLYHKDAHTSLVGVREVATAGSRCFASNEEVEDWLFSGDRNEGCLSAEDTDHLRLFAYPAQSNMTGHRLPLSWSQRLRQSRNISHRNSYTLLDAASYLTTGRLDLSDASAAPDFISLSFYKIFGFPDLGALVVRKEAGDILKSRKYFGGGTVDMVIDVNESWHAMRDKELHEVLEDGTLPFHNIVSLQHAMDVQKRVFGSAENISCHASTISTRLYRDLVSMLHLNGKPVVQVYQELNSSYSDEKSQGPIIAFNVLDSNGEWVGKSRFEKLAIACGIQLRTGGVCNPGGIATMLQLEPWEMRRNFCEGMRCGDDLDVLGGKPTGIIRASLGPMTTIKDIETLVRFLRFFFVESAPRQEKSDPGSPTLRDPIDACENITLVEGCRAFILPSTSPKANHNAYAAWDHEWCIVDQPSGVPLHPGLDALKNLDVSIHPKSGVLRIKNNSPSKGNSSTSSHFGRSAGPQSSLVDPLVPPRPLTVNSVLAEAGALVIDLWTPPPHRTCDTRSRSGRIPDVYTQPEYANFLTNALGFPCRLARYRPKLLSVSKAAQKCVISTCGKDCSNSEELKSHYGVHKVQFQGFTARQGLNGVIAKEHRPYEWPLVDLGHTPDVSLNRERNKKKKVWVGLVLILEKLKHCKEKSGAPVASRAVRRV